MEMGHFRPSSLAIVLACCGRVGFDVQTTGSGSDMGEGVDTVDGADACVGFGSFGIPMPLGALNSTSVDSAPFLTADELTIYFHSLRSGPTRDIWTATRMSLADSFPSPLQASELNSTDEDQEPSVTADGLIVLLSSDRPGSTGAHDLWIAQRGARTEPFATPVRVAELSSPSDDIHPSLSSDGLSVVFSSNRPGGSGSYDLWIATRSDRSVPFSSPTPFAAVNSSSVDAGPAWDADRREIYFQSTRGGPYNVWYSDGSSGSFSSPTRVDELSSASGSEYPSWISADRRRLYMSSSRSGGDWELYVAERSCL
jgi:Tol biopolymer transport system component